MGFFRGLDTESYDRSYTDGQLLKRIAGYFGQHRKSMIGIIFFMSLISVVGAIQPLIVSRAVDALEGQLTMNFIWLISVAMFLLGFVVWGASWIRRRMQVRVIGDVVAGLRRDAFNASIGHDMAFFDEFESGRIMSRITGDTQEFAQVVQLVTDIATQFLQIFILFFVLINISWQMTLLVIGMFPVVLAFTLGFRKVARYVTRRGFEVLGRVNASIQESITGISVAKNYRQEAAIYHEFASVNQQAYEVNLRRGFVMSSVFPLLNTLSAIGTAALLYWGGISAGTGLIVVSSWYLFMVSLDRFWFPMTNLSAFWSQFQGGLAASERIFALIDAKPLVHQTDNRPVESLKGEIVYKNVDFRYSDQEKVLDDFTLRIAPGESIALVGHTGAGKSSLVKLITRFYEFQGGELLVDGQDIRTFDLHSYRRHLGIVSQSPFLFSGTVADNIRYARPELTDVQIEAVARRIGNGEWLETLPEGLHSDVGERGARLSMGQRQLVALTRVLVQEPAIFILDEATASIDPFTEAQIQEAMDLILKKSTSIMIAHRLSTVRSADRIIVLKKGKIIEEGSHEQLITQNGHYAELYNTYFRHQSLEYVEAAGKRQQKSASKVDHRQNGRAKLAVRGED